MATLDSCEEFILSLAEYGQRDILGATLLDVRRVGRAIQAHHVGAAVYHVSIEHASKNSLSKWLGVVP